jgi:hypothetical protein
MDRDHQTAGRIETDDHDIRATLATIRDQTGQTLELLRTLVSLIVPELGDREGPRLEELLAKLIVQQREILTIARRTQADVRAIGDRLSERDDRNGHGAPNGAARSC